MSPVVIHLVRHGESEWNREGRVQGQARDAGGLTARGLEDAQRVAGELAGTAATVIITSDIPRARDTAAVIGRVLDRIVTADARLREQRLGVFEGRYLDDPWNEGTVSDAIEALWLEPDRQPEGGESVRSLTDRILVTLESIAGAHDDEEIVVVTHGGPIRALRGLAQGAAALDGSDDVPNGTVISFLIAPGAVRPLVTEIGF